MQVLKVLFICLIFTIFSFAQNSKQDAAKFLFTISGSGGAILHASFSPDGRKILLVSKESTQVFSAETGRLLFSFPEKIPVSDGFNIKWQPNGSKFAVFDSSDSGFIFNRKSPSLLYDAETGKRIAVLEGKEKAVRRAVWSKNGDRILTFNTKSDRYGEIELSVWTENGEFINSLYNDTIRNLQFIDGGKKLIFDQGFRIKEKPIVIWDVERAQRTKSFDQTYQKRDFWNVAGLIAISPDENLICGDYDVSKGLICWETDGDESIKFAFKDDKETGDHYFCGFSSDGKRFAVLKSKPNRIELINSGTGKSESFIEDSGKIGCASAEKLDDFSSWSSDDRFFITHNDDDKLSFWETATGKLTGSFKLIEKYQIPNGYIDFDALGFHPTKPILMSVSNKLIRLWNLETGEMIKKFEKDEIGERVKQTRFANWSLDGTLLMTGAKQDNAISLWEILPK